MPRLNNLCNTREIKRRCFPRALGVHLIFQRAKMYARRIFLFRNFSPKTIINACQTNLNEWMQATAPSPKISIPRTRGLSSQLLDRCSIKTYRNTGALVINIGGRGHTGARSLEFLAAYNYWFLNYWSAGAPCKMHSCLWITGEDWRYSAFTSSVFDLSILHY